MSKFGIKQIGFKELERAIKRNPKAVASETKKFLTKGIALYNRTIVGSPWKVNQSGGGVPVATLESAGYTGGQTKQSIIVDTSKRFEASIYPDLKIFRKTWKGLTYPELVHQGTRRMKKRPWLDFAREKNKRKIGSLARELLANITKDLAR